MTSKANKKLHLEIVDRYESAYQTEENVEEAVSQKLWSTLSIEDKLLARPVEGDTKIKSVEIVQFDGFLGLLVSWSWDGISGQSIIILIEDRDRFESDEECRKFLFRQIELIGVGSITMKSMGSWFCLNYFFQNT